MMSVQNGRWIDERCNYKFNYVCKKAKEETTVKKG